MFGRMDGSGSICSCSIIPELPAGRAEQTSLKKKKESQEKPSSSSKAKERRRNKTTQRLFAVRRGYIYIEEPPPQKKRHQRKDQKVGWLVGWLRTSPQIRPRRHIPPSLPTLPAPLGLYYISLHSPIAPRPSYIGNGRGGGGGGGESLAVPVPVRRDDMI